ncbi:hypothetical protein F0L74_09595 [Chitinophaga agrisoli]|uniref:Uncharacterized protein n=1 Tax=Chitinophaga agrisoli TaxID=2607653 RepID=A0A5B2VU68_9BACT|nr:hypothetical protein [Chitinophaga agrisoli]KAA2242771.1 hypothetical protein F0L74_09595 [Chitinophaga agrisoli]
MLVAKDELHTAASRPGAPSYNLDLADVCASLLQFDSAVYFIRQELAARDISGKLRDYKMLFLLMRDPAMYKQFTDGVFFGRYNIDSASGLKRYVPSEFCMQYIERELLIGPVYSGWSSNFYYKNVKMTWEEGQSLKKQFEQVAKYMEEHLLQIAPGEYVNRKRLPQYSKDGKVPVDKFVETMSRVLRDLVANKTVEITALLEKKELPNRICYDVDNELLDQGKPQRYGMRAKMENGKPMLQLPHDNLRDIAAHRKLAGLNTWQEMIREEEKSFKNIGVLLQ